MGAELEAMIPTRPWPRTYNITCTHIQRGQVHTPSHYGTHTPDSSSIGYGEWFVGCSKYKGKYLSTSCLYSRPMTRQEKDMREVQVYISSCERTPTRKKPRKRRRPSPQQRDVGEIRIVLLLLLLLLLLSFIIIIIIIIITTFELHLDHNLL